jgi:TP901 family phage tail tape measure protein
MGTKVAEIFALFGIQRDQASFNKARDDLGRFVKQADTRMQALGKSIGKLGQKKVGTLGGVTSALGLGGMAGKLAPLAIGAGLVVAARDALKFDDALTMLDISSKGAMGSMDAVRSRVLAVSRATGVSKEELVAGSAAFVALTGDGKLASESMETFARVQKATGAAMEDIVGAAASINEQLGIQGPEFERAFSILVAGGKAGKIELKDMASLMASLSAQYKQFGASQGIGGLATIGSAFQITAKNFGSASEAATGLEALMTSLLQNSKQLKKEQGIDVFEEDGKTLRSLEAITSDIAGKNLNAAQTLALLHRKEAVNTFNALRDNRGQWEEIRQATINANDIQEDYDKRQASSSAKVAKLWNDIKITIAEAFTPERIEAFVAALKGAVELAAELGGWIKELTDGEKGKVAQMEGDDALQAALDKGGSVDAIAAAEMPEEPSFLMRQAEKTTAAGGIAAKTRGDRRALILAARRRKDADAKTAKNDAALRTEQFMRNPGLMEIEAHANAFDATAAPMVNMAKDKAGGGVQVTSPITVHTQPGADGKQIAVEVRSAWEKFWDAKVGDLSANAGGD